MSQGVAAVPNFLSRKFVTKNQQQFAANSCRRHDQMATKSKFLEQNDHCHSLPFDPDGQMIKALRSF